MVDSIRVSEQGIAQVDQVRVKKGWSKYQEDWYDSAKVSISTLKRFWSREPIRPKSFAALCKAIGIDNWEKLVEDPNSLSGTIIKNRYKINRPLKDKNYEVYLAQDLDFPGQPNCIVKKLAATKMSERNKMLFDREVDALYKLGKHVQIPSLLAHFEENNDYYLVEEYIEGQAIREELMEDKKWDKGKAIQFLEEALELLQSIHQSRCIHRNINPNNVIRRESDQKLVFISFGGIKTIPKDTLAITRTVLNITKRSEAYIAPEQMFGAPNFCSDIYSIGIIAIQAITNFHPQELRRHRETLDIVWRDSAAISSDLKDILDKMVCYDLQHRYQSVQEVLDGLIQIN